MEDRLRTLWTARDEANWVNENFITDDTDALAAAGEEATAGYIAEAIQRSKRFDGIRAELPADVARKLYLLSMAQTIPAPHDAKKRAELAALETPMTSAYGKGTILPTRGVTAPGPRQGGLGRPEGTGVPPSRRPFASPQAEPQAGRARGGGG